MTASTIAAGLLFAVIYAGLEIREVMIKKKERNSKTRIKERLRTSTVLF